MVGSKNLNEKGSYLGNGEVQSNKNDDRDEKDVVSNNTQQWFMKKLCFREVVTELKFE